MHCVAAATRLSFSGKASGEEAAVRRKFISRARGLVDEHTYLDAKGLRHPLLLDIPQRGGLHSARQARRCRGRQVLDHRGADEHVLGGNSAATMLALLNELERATHAWPMQRRRRGWANKCGGRDQWRHSNQCVYEVRVAGRSLACRARRWEAAAAVPAAKKEKSGRGRLSAAFGGATVSNRQRKCAGNGR